MYRLSGTCGFALVLFAYSLSEKKSALRPQLGQTWTRYIIVQYCYLGSFSA